MQFLDRAGTLLRCMADPEVPLRVKITVCLIIAYIVSPLDIIPDFIPVLGLLDEALLVPWAVSFAWRMVPAHIREKHAAGTLPRWPRRLVIGGILIVLFVWLVMLLTAASILEYYLV